MRGTKAKAIRRQALLQFAGAVEAPRRLVQTRPCRKTMAVTEDGVNFYKVPTSAHGTLVHARFTERAIYQDGKHGRPFTYRPA